MRHVVHFSGGKDSTALLLMMLEQGMKVDDIVMANTTLEFPELWEYVARVERYIGRPIKIIRPEKNFDFEFYNKRKKGRFKGEPRYFPSVTNFCWWTRDAKIDPLQKYMTGNINYLGIAVDEAHRASSKRQNAVYRYPLVDWGITETDCFKYLKERNLENPLYKYFTRLGCWLCPKQRKKELEQLWTHWPLLWWRLKQYTKDVPDWNNPFLVAHGKYLEDLEKEFYSNTKQQTLFDR